MNITSQISKILYSISLATNSILFPSSNQCWINQGPTKVRFGFLCSTARAFLNKLLFDWVFRAGQVGRLHQQLEGESGPTLHPGTVNCRSKWAGLLVDRCWCASEESVWVNNLPQHAGMLGEGKPACQVCWEWNLALHSSPWGRAHWSLLSLFLHQAREGKHSSESSLEAAVSGS